MRARLGLLALFAGLYDGIAIARYDVLMSDASVARVVLTIGVVAGVVALHGIGWQVLGAINSSLFRKNPDATIRGAATLWLLIAMLSRGGPDAFPSAPAWIIPITLLAVAWLLPNAIRRRFPFLFGSTWIYLTVTATSTVALLGRVPDPAAGRFALASFTAGSAIIASLLALLIRRAPKVSMASVATVAAILLGVRAFVPTADSHQGDPPNVVWIVVDTLRRDHIQPYADIASTPAIAKLAREGALFTDAVTVAPKTSLAVASLLTGLYPTRHGVRTLYDRLDERQVTLPELFRDKGYHTAAFVNNAWLRRGLGYDQGFEQYHGWSELTRPYGSFRYVAWVGAVDRLFLHRMQPFDGQTNAATVTRGVVDYLDELSGREPFFIYAHYFEPHWPYRPSTSTHTHNDDCEVNRRTESGARARMIFHNDLDEAENATARRLYAGEVEETSQEIGRLLNALDGGGLSGRTIVVFTADHGHALGEHDYFFHHGAFLYDDTLRIPLIVRWPGTIPANTTVTEPVRSTDIAATLLDLAGLPAPSTDGMSLVPLMRNETSARHATYVESDVKMYAENDRRERYGVAGKLRGVRDGRHKLVLTPTKDRGFRLELFDLQTDPGEARDLSSDPTQRDVMERLMRVLKRSIPPAEWDAILGPPNDDDSPTEGIGEAELQLLRSLGYI